MTIVSEGCFNIADVRKMLADSINNDSTAVIVRHAYFRTFCNGMIQLSDLQQCRDFLKVCWASGRTYIWDALRWQLG